MGFCSAFSITTTGIGCFDASSLSDICLSKASKIVILPSGASPGLPADSNAERGVQDPESKHELLQFSRSGFLHVADGFARQHKLEPAFQVPSPMSGQTVDRDGSVATDTGFVGLPA
jgi:hypothetical protein